MARATSAVQLKNVTLDVLLLPQGDRAPTTATITAGDGAGNGGTLGDTTLLLDVDAGNSPLDLKAGNSLVFRSQATTTVGQAITKSVQVLVRADATLTNGTPVAVSVFPLTDDIADTSTASFVVGLKSLAGIQDFSFSTSDQEVDSTDTLSGFGQETELVRSDKTVDISGIERQGDDATFNVIYAVGLDGATYAREIWAVLTLPNGTTHTGAAKVKNLQLPGNQNEIGKYSFQLQFQGDSYAYTSPYTFS